MSETENVTYREIHAYMLKKTQEYYQDPPAVLVDAVLADQKAKGIDLPREAAKKLISLIDIQRYLKKEMQEKWPEFMSRIPSNSLKDR